VVRELVKNRKDESEGKSKVVGEEESKDKGKRVGVDKEEGVGE